MYLRAVHVRKFPRTRPRPSLLNLLHLLFGKVHQNTSHRTLTRLGLADGHIGVVCNFGSIGWIITIRKTHFERKWRVSHVKRSSWHVGDRVGIRMSIHKQLILPIAQKAGGSTSGDAAIRIESCSETGGFFNKYFAINDPGRESLEGVTVKSSDLERTTRVSGFTIRYCRYKYCLLTHDSAFLLPVDWQSALEASVLSPSQLIRRQD
jgi:hypothetical protein